AEPAGRAGRRGARAGAGDALPEARLVLVQPALLARAGVVADHGLVVVALLLREQPVADDDQRRPARPDALPPQRPGPLGAPVGRDGDAADHAVARRTPESDPVTGRGREGTLIRRLAHLVLSGRPLRPEQVLRRGTPAPADVALQVG